MLGPCQRQHVRKTLRFGGRNAAAESRKPVIAAALVIEFAGGPFFGLDHQAIADQAPKNSIESACAQAHGTVRQPCDLLHDGIAVFIAVGERDKDVKKQRK